MSWQISAVYASVMGLMLIYLSLRVVRLRRSLRVGLGQGESQDLARAIRVQANFAEYVPIGLILLLLAEQSGASYYWLHALGLMLLTGRVLHMIGLSGNSGVSFGRFYGTLLTWLMIILTAVSNLYFALTA